MKVFLSSTSLDLAEHRAAVIDRLRQLNHQPIAMETFGSKAGDAETVSLQEVQKADIFVGIYAHRYGYRPDNDKSVTELEYVEAKKHNIPRLIFLIDDAYRHALVDEHAEPDTPENFIARAFLANFKERLQNEAVLTWFQDPDDLATKVTDAIHNWLADKANTSSIQQQSGDSITVNQSGNGIAIGKISGGTQNFDSMNDKSSRKDDD